MFKLNHIELYWNNSILSPLANLIDILSMIIVDYIINMLILKSDHKLDHNSLHDSTVDL